MSNHSTLQHLQGVPSRLPFRINGRIVCSGLSSSEKMTNSNSPQGFCFLSSSLGRAAALELNERSDTSSNKSFVRRNRLIVRYLNLQEETLFLKERDKNDKQSKNIWPKI